MVRIDERSRVDLQRIVARVGILKQAVHRVQHFMGEQEEPLPGHTPVVQAVFALELDVETAAQVVGVFAQNLNLFCELLNC